MTDRVEWDGVLRAFGDPDRKPGEPWVASTTPELRARLDRELDASRGGPEHRLAVDCQRVARLAIVERDRYIAAAVAAGARVVTLAADLGLSRQQVYAIAHKARDVGSCGDD